MNYYNEHDPAMGRWLEELIDMNQIPAGDVDTRSIIDVDAKDLQGYTQVHLFAGIGGWSLALQQAGWPENVPVWTGSCPCQPFSAAGNRKGKDDDRHLLPDFLRLIGKCRPDTVFGEQVIGAIKYGWLDDLQTELEAENYAIGHCVLGAHSVNAPHIRQRLYWVGNTTKPRLERTAGASLQGKVFRSAGNVEYGRMAITEIDRRREGCEGVTERKERSKEKGSHFRLASCGVDDSGVGNAQHNGHLTIEKQRSTETSSNHSPERTHFPGQPSGTSGPEFTEDLCWATCADGKQRPFKPGILPLADGVSRNVVPCSDSGIAPNDTQEARVARLKGYGNAIVPQVAAEFIRAYMARGMNVAD